MTRMFNPAHPGDVLKDGVFADGSVTVTEAAKALGVTRVALSRVLNGRAAVSAEMAVRLGTGPEVWINMQAQHDLWRTEHALRSQVKRYTASYTRTDTPILEDPWLTICPLIPISDPAPDTMIFR